MPKPSCFTVPLEVVATIGPRISHLRMTQIPDSGAAARSTRPMPAAVTHGNIQALPGSASLEPHASSRPTLVPPLEAPRLPIDLLWEIARHIDTPKGLASFGAASRALRDMARDVATPEISRRFSAAALAQQAKLKNKAEVENLQSVLDWCRDVSTEGVSSESVIKRVLNIYAQATKEDLRKTRSITLSMPQSILVPQLSTLLRRSIYSPLGTALANLAGIDDVSTIVKFDGGDRAGPLVLSKAAPLARMAHEFFVIGRGDGRPSEQGLAEAIGKSAGKLRVVDLDWVEVDGRPLLSELRKPGNEVTRLAMWNSRVDPADLAGTLRAPNNRLRELEVGVELHGAGSLQPIADALLGMECKLIGLALNLHTRGVTITPLAEAIREPLFKLSNLTLVANGVSGRHQLALARAAASKPDFRFSIGSDTRLTPAEKREASAIRTRSSERIYVLGEKDR